MCSTRSQSQLCAATLVSSLHYIYYYIYLLLHILFHQFHTLISSLSLCLSLSRDSGNVDAILPTYPENHDTKI